MTFLISVGGEAVLAVLALDGWDSWGMAVRMALASGLTFIPFYWLNRAVDVIE